MISADENAANSHSSCFFSSEDFIKINRLSIDIFQILTLAGVTMNKEGISGKTGLELLIRECRRRFRIPENINHYSAEDFREAEKKFLKLCLISGSWRHVEE
jgi:hypothetical protein